MPDKQDGKKLGRRQFLKWSAGAGLAAVLSSPFLPVLNPVKAANVPLPGPSHDTSHSNEGGDPKKVRAWTMVVDLKKCDGCVTIDAPPQCTQACIDGHFAPKGQEWIQIFGVDLPGGGQSFLPVPCYQCENAPCVNVCPVAATYHNEDGVVLIDHKRCIGCRMCMAACPYHRRFFNWAAPEVPPEAALAHYSPLYPVPAVKGTVIKCMFCAHFLRDGKLPYCVAGCPMKALYMGDRNEDIASNGVEVVQLSKFLDENDAFRWKEGLGTQPRVWYLPGHGQNFNRHASDPRPLKRPVWNWGGDGYNYQIEPLTWKRRPNETKD
ncbi:MAG: 4Fe-4S dicluster domain-containing protein [Chloroflexi bacterium]|nr:4Fe-4S dicluster domain-containing protein [Chloroflexota bacterium]